MNLFKFKKNKLFSNEGYTALLAVLVISAIALVMARSISLSGLTGLDSNFISGEALIAQSVAEGCVEDVLRRISLDSELSGELPVFGVGDGFCRVNIIQADGSKNIEASGVYKNFHKKISLILAFDNDRLQITSWLEQ